MNDLSAATTSRAVRLDSNTVEKPWGRDDVPALFGAPAGVKTGEVWFQDSARPDLPLLVKYLFTSEKLSIQVHPNDAQAQASGLKGGKSECWYVLDATPDARLGIGLVAPVDEETLRAAALDGSIEAMLDWKPVQAGSFYYIPAGTIHAIGVGLTLLEVQQNNDVTYRLYDYGRPRPLHLDESLAVAARVPYPYPEQILPEGTNALILDGTERPFSLRMFALEAGEESVLEAEQGWFIPVTGSGTINGDGWRSGECWLTSGSTCIVAQDAMTGFFAVPR